MLRAPELAARAAELTTLAEKTDDLSLAKSLQQRARYLSAMAHEITVLERDPPYRRIHDAPTTDLRGEPSSLGKSA
jgi:hypothetical protein